MGTAGGGEVDGLTSPASAMLAWPVIMLAISLTALLASLRTSAGSFVGKHDLGDAVHKVLMHSMHDLPS